MPMLISCVERLSPYERGVDGVAPVPKSRSSDDKGSRLARPDPLYESLFGRASRFGAAANPMAVDTMPPLRPPSDDSADSDEFSHTFTLLNSFWFMIASLLQQGTDLLPRSLSTRMVAGMWWFFTLIMISSYTANLAAFLTVERMESPVESAEGLSKQHSIKYGCLAGGSTAAFFRDSKIETYARMHVFMDSDKGNYVSSNALGVERVIKDKGKYAFLMESTTVEYVVERHCELEQVGGLLDSKGYGIALPPNSPYRTPISSAILQLQEGGKLHLYKEKWWKQKKGGGQCKEAKDSSTANELSLKNVGGVFLVLVCGLVISLIVACSERCWYNRKMRKLPRPPPQSTSASSNVHLPPDFTAETLTDANTILNSRGSFKNNGHVVMLANDPTMCTNHRQISGSVGHLNDPGVGAGGFLTTSLSAAALNQASCAVPTMQPPPPPPPHAHHVLHHQSSLSSTPGGPGNAPGNGAGGWDHHALHHRRPCADQPCPAHFGAATPGSDFKYSDDEHTS